jgi:hypothetical protein
VATSEALGHDQAQACRPIVETLARGKGRVGDDGEIDVVEIDLRFSHRMLSGAGGKRIEGPEVNHLLVIMGEVAAGFDGTE